MKISEIINETATAGATSSANIASVVNPIIAHSKKKVNQPKDKNGVAKNALDIKGTSLFGGPIEEDIINSPIIKRR